MKFELVNILQKISELYKLPKTKERFDKYLFILQGNTKDELLLPIAGFNPMGNELATNQLEQLIQLNAEDIAGDEILKINSTLNTNDNRTIQVGLNLVDDVEGSWSNYYTTDYKSKFEIESLLKRNFCTPHFWTNEILTEEIIRQRVRAYIYRTLFWIKNKKPETLADCLEQEIYVQTHSSNNTNSFEEHNFSEIEKFYQKHFKSADYNLKFNFFYGDQASKQLEYSQYGIKEKDGFEYAKFISQKKK